MPKRSIATNAKSSDPLTYFTDREDILKKFKDFLHSDSANHLVLAVKGNSGTGKTFLISYLIECLCPENWHASQISFTPLEEPDFQSILRGLENVFASCVPEESLQLYRSKKHEYDNKYKYSTSVNINLSAEASKEAEVSNVKQTVQNVNIEAPRTEVPRSLRDSLCDALVELSKNVLCPLCLFIDGYERLAETNPGLVRWLFGEVLFRLSHEVPYPIRVITCGWEWPSDANVEPFYTDHVKIDDFDLTQMKNYLKKRRVIARTTKLYTAEHEKLVEAFFYITKGHPLFLALAVTYFYRLKPHERTAESLKSDRPLIDFEARIQFLDGHLATHLREPYLTLFQVGPILRSFDYSALQALLNVRTDSVTTASSSLELNDKVYERFLQYPFIYRKSGSSYNFSFHGLVRRVRLEALRIYPQDKERFHRKMADFYMEAADAVEEKEIVHAGSEIKRIDAEWLIEIAEEKFKALLEWFYHTLQVKKLQADTFKRWEILTEQAIQKGYHQRAGLLFELVRQLTEEGEPFLSDTSDAYKYYSIWYDRYIEQQQARRIPSKWELSSTLPTTPRRLATIPSSHEEALSFKEEVRSSTAISSFLRSISNMHESQESLSAAQKIFGEKEIMPTQLNHTINLLQNAVEHIRFSQKLIETSALLPLTVVPLRFPILLKLHHTNEQLNRLISLVTHFRETSLRSSRQQVRGQLEIQDGLKSLIQSFDEVIESSNIFLNQTRFEE